jgi:hypothetical protein
MKTHSIPQPRPHDCFSGSVCGEPMRIKPHQTAPPCAHLSFRFPCVCRPSALSPLFYFTFPWVRLISPTVRYMYRPSRHRCILCTCICLEFIHTCNCLARLHSAILTPEDSINGRAITISNETEYLSRYLVQCDGATRSLTV